MDTIAFFIGGLLAVVLITTIFNWLLRTITVPISRILISNALSLFVTTTLGGFGLSDGSDPEFGKAFSLYVLPQLTFLIFSLWKFNRNNAKTQQSSHHHDYREPLRHTPSLNLPIQPRMTPPAKRHANQRDHSAPPPQSTNFIVRYWRGGFSLGVSYWMFGFLGGILVAVIPYIAFAIFSPNSGYEPTAIFAALVFTWVFVLAITLWQIVGVWRSADNHMQSRLRLGLTSPWAALAKMAVIIGALNLAVQLFGVVIPQLVETTRMAFMDDPDIPNYSIRVMRNGTEAEVTGGFKYGLTDDFVKILSASPQVHVVHLNSIGGRIGEAEKLYEVIRANRIITYVSANCMSACTVAFAGGTERWLRDGATLGFHAPYFPGMSQSDLQEYTASQRKIFAAAGFTSGFIEKALATPNSDMWTPPNSELFSSKVVTALSNGTNLQRRDTAEAFPKKLWL